MYALIDRPVAMLCEGSRFTLFAMRGWTEALARGSCPPGALATPFLARGVIDALPSFHRLMAALNHQACETVLLRPTGHPRIGEWEAILLSLWRDAAEAPCGARGTLGLILREEAADPAFEALVTAEARFVAGGIVPHGLAGATRAA